MLPKKREKLFHVVLREKVLSEPDEKSSALKRLLQKAGARKYDTRRFERHGILSCTVQDPAALEALRTDPAVEDVEAEGVMHAI